MCFVLCKQLLLKNVNKKEALRLCQKSTNGFSVESSVCRLREQSVPLCSTKRGQENQLPCVAVQWFK